MILSSLYTLLIGPLELLFEFIYSFAYRLFGNPGLAIIFLSLAMNFLVLPLYKQADAMQEEERKTEQRLKKWTTHIKKTFSGDERFMMLQTYYRQNNYKPTDVLKGSVSLLLEIPFFMAAYHFLSGLSILRGVSFGPIANLGAPDGLLVIGGIAINVLPILMTAINLISSAIYTKGMSAQSKVQLYGMAALFLILLYQSPAGLVFYWTLNNLFSLVKNIFYKLKDPKAVLCRLSSGVGLVLLPVVLLAHLTPRKRLAMVLILLMMQLPYIWHALKKRNKGLGLHLSVQERPGAFYCGGALLALLMGVLIPSAVIQNSPEEFMSAVSMTDPLSYVLHSGLVGLGIFVVWFSVFYKLMGSTGKKVLSLGVWGLCGIAFVNYMFMGKSYGGLTAQLTFKGNFSNTAGEKLVNLAVLLAVLAVMYLIWQKKGEIVKAIYIAAGVAVIGMSAMNIVQINGVVAPKMQQMQQEKTKMPTIPLSRSGRNVVVIMMDRGVSGYVPYILNEKPELKEKFDGFTYYPNTISYGISTNVGAPALYGGYEYRPFEMNKRDQELLQVKSDEALKVMPVIFDNAGFDVTVCNPTHAGYHWHPDLSIYDEYPDIHAYNMPTDIGEDKLMFQFAKEEALRRDFFCYSMVKVAPLALQPYIYDSGKYHSLNGAFFQICTGNSTATGIDEIFVTPYEQLKLLPEITEITEGENNTFMMMSNDTTHNPIMLQEPEYVPSNQVDNVEYDRTHTDRFTLNGRTLHMDTYNQIIHYHANMATFIQLGNWFEYLQKNGVYDNTRIIIVADHGHSLSQFDDMLFGEGDSRDVMRYNPLFMVKDFGAKGMTTDMGFMTNADVPTLATNGLIQEPVNPFTGKQINSDPKHNEEEQKIFYTNYWNIQENNGTQFLPGQWFAVSENIFDMSNWKEIPEPVFD